MYCAPEVFDGNRYNASVDVYSFAMTLFAVLCGHGHVQEEYRKVHRMAACSGWRPKPTDAVKEKLPLVWRFIQECWCSEKITTTTTSKKRPTFAKIVEILEAMCPMKHDSEADAENAFPKSEARFVCTAVSTEEWRRALCLDTDAQLRAVHHVSVAEELELCRETGAAWTVMSHGSIPGNVEAEWRSTESATSARLYRFTIPLEHDDHRAIFSALCASFGTAKCLTLGDKSVSKIRVIGAIDDSHLVLWQSMTMPRPLREHVCSTWMHFSLSNFKLCLVKH